MRVSKQRRSFGKLVCCGYCYSFQDGPKELMITILFYNPEDTLLCRLTAHDQAEEARTVPAMLRRMQKQMGWDGTIPGHHFSTQPMNDGHSRQVIYFIDGQRVGWYLYYQQPDMTSPLPGHRPPTRLRQRLHHCRMRSRFLLKDSPPFLR
jgi:hypothetical protein